MRLIDIKLLHPITLTQPLVLEIPCHKISREHRLHGGPSLEEIERAILERPSTSSTASSGRRGQKNSATGTQNEDFDILYAEVKTIPVKASADVESKYGVSRLPAERKRGVFGNERDDRIRRGRKSPEDEKKEDEEILGRLMEWKGFYGGFEGLQEAYRPLSAVLPVRAPPSEQNGRPASIPTRKAEILSTEELAAQKEAEKRTLEERLNAEREYWRKRREVEKTMEKEGESSESASRPTPSPTLLQRLLKGDSENASPATNPSSAASSAPPTPARAPTTEATTLYKEAAAPLNKAQARLVEQARHRAREESTSSPFKALPFIGGGKTFSQQGPPDQQSSAASKGFKPDTSKKEGEEGLLESWSQWFKKRV